MLFIDSMVDGFEEQNNCSKECAYVNTGASFICETNDDPDQCPDHFARDSPVDYSAPR